MAINKRISKSPDGGSASGIDGFSGVDGRGNNDDKLLKDQFEKDRVHRKTVFLFAVAVVVSILFVTQTQWDGKLYKSLLPHKTETTGLKGAGSTKGKSYELYPFLVSSEAVQASGKDLGTVLSKPTLPKFPVISKLENCKLTYTPSDPPRKENWRYKFWIPSFPGSGGSNPSKRGNILKPIVENLFSGEGGSDKYLNPVKDFHVSIKNKLKRCKGVSETVGCTCTHPQTSSSPSTLTEDFRPGVVLPIRNPAAAIPAFFAYKNIAYHQAAKQANEKAWKESRDQFLEVVFQEWLKNIKYWRGTTDDSAYYHTKVYVPLEDLLTIDVTIGAAKIKEISDAISGRKNDKDGDFFETSSLEQDYECVWYRNAKENWEHQQEVIGDYIPMYTQHQKTYMINELRKYAKEVETDVFNREQDNVLVSLMRRYADQIEAYVRLEPGFAGEGGNFTS